MLTSYNKRKQCSSPQKRLPIKTTKTESTEKD